MGWYSREQLSRDLVAFMVVLAWCGSVLMGLAFVLGSAGWLCR